MALTFSTITIVLAIAAYAFASEKSTGATSCASLKYTSVVSEKPDLITINVIMHGICRIRSNETQTTLPDYNVNANNWISGLGYDPLEQAIYHAGMGAFIYKTRLSDSKQQVVYTLDWEIRQIIGTIQDFAYDWINRGFYVLFENAVGYLDLKVTAPKVKILRANESIYQKILVHPQRGYLFLLQRAYDNTIVRTNLEGTDRVVVVNFTEFYKPNHQYARIESMALDIEEDRLYWSVTPSTYLVRHSALDGSDERRFESTPIFNAGAMAIGKKYVYYSSFGRINRYEKKSGVDSWNFNIDNAGDISVSMLILPEDLTPTIVNAGSFTTSKIDISARTVSQERVPGSAAQTTTVLSLLLPCVAALSHLMANFLSFIP